MAKIQLKFLGREITLEINSKKFNLQILRNKAKEELKSEKIEIPHLVFFHKGKEITTNKQLTALQTPAITLDAIPCNSSKLKSTNIQKVIQKLAKACSHKSYLKSVKQIISSSEGGNAETPFRTWNPSPFVTALIILLKAVKDNKETSKLSEKIIAESSGMSGMHLEDLPKNPKAALLTLIMQYDYALLYKSLNQEIDYSNYPKIDKALKKSPTSALTLLCDMYIKKNSEDYKNIKGLDLIIRELICALKNTNTYRTRKNTLEKYLPNEKDAPELPELLNPQDAWTDVVVYPKSGLPEKYFTPSAPEFEENTEKVEKKLPLINPKVEKKISLINPYGFFNSKSLKTVGLEQAVRVLLGPSLPQTEKIWVKPVYSNLKKRRQAARISFAKESDATMFVKKLKNIGIGSTKNSGKIKSVQKKWGRFCVHLGLEQCAAFIKHTESELLDGFQKALKNNKCFTNSPKIKLVDDRNKTDRTVEVCFAQKEDALAFAQHLQNVGHGSKSATGKSKAATLIHDDQYAIYVTQQECRDIIFKFKADQRNIAPSNNVFGGGGGLYK